MQDVVHGIKVDYSRDSLFDELGKIRLKESYMKEEEVSPQDPVLDLTGEIIKSRDAQIKELRNSYMDNLVHGWGG